jgi:hypothetical protein
MTSYVTPLMLWCTTLMLLAAPKPAFTQAAGPPSTTRNAVYVELLGNGGLYSINYERVLTNFNYERVMAGSVRARVGGGAWTDNWSDLTTSIETFTFPMMVQMVMERERGSAHHPELGIGILVGQRGTHGFLSLTGLVGYRYEPPRGRLLLRVGLTPFYGFGDESVAYPDKGFFPSVGLTVGARF